VTQLVESQPVKTRLGGWFEMTTSLEGSQLKVESCTGGCDDRT
jgi:hypothetical protein